MQPPVVERREPPSPRPHAHPLRMPRFSKPRYGQVRVSTGSPHPCWLCGGTIPMGSTCLALRISGNYRGTVRAYACTGCIVNRGGPNLRRQAAAGWYAKNTRLLVLPTWVDPADPFAEEAV